MFTNMDIVDSLYVADKFRVELGVNKYDEDTEMYVIQDSLETAKVGDVMSIQTFSKSGTSNRKYIYMGNSEWNVK